jgi:hypothetical protein
MLWLFRGSAGPVLVSTEHEGPTHALSLTRHIKPQIIHTDGVAIQRAGPKCVMIPRNVRTGAVNLA